MSDHWGTPPQPPEQPEPAQPSQASQPEILSSRTGDILGSPEPAAKRGGKAKFVAAGIGAVAVAAIGVGAAYAAGALGGGGAQPDTLVPATAVGYVSVDLDPSLGQKVDALRFLRKFPAAKKSIGSTDDLRQWVFEQATKDDPSFAGVSYAKDVKPWIGDRFAVAAVPAGSGHAPDAVVVLQVSDEGKAKAGLKKLMSQAGDGVCSVSDGYAVCAQTQAILTAAQSAAAKHSLADDAHYQADVDAVGKRGIALGWGDLDKVSSLVPAASQSLSGSLGGALGGSLGGLSSLGSTQSSGRVVASLRFDGTDLHLTAQVHGSKASAKTGAPGTGVEALPNTTLAAFGGSLDATTLDQGYAALKKQMTTAGGPDILGAAEQQLAQLGLTLPKDLDAIVGTKFAVAFGGMGTDGLPQVGIRSNADPAKAGAVLDKISSQLAGAGAPFALHHEAASKGYAVALSPAYAKQLASAGHLGDQATFKAAVPDAAKSQGVFFIDIAGLVDGTTLSAFGLGSPVDPNVKALGAVGMSSQRTGSDSATIQVTLTTR